MPPVLLLLWSHKEAIAKGIAVAVAAFAAWWFFIHNPRTIKALETKVAETQHQVELRDNAINLLGEIRKDQERITDAENENIKAIRTSRKPGNRGVFVSDGLLADLYTGSAAN